MIHLKLPVLIFLSAFILLAWSCNNSSDNDKKDNAAQASANDSTPTANSSTHRRIAAIPLPTPE